MLGAHSRLPVRGGGRASGWRLLGPVSWLLILTPHQSEQMRQGPGGVTARGWLVSPGSSRWDLHGSCVNHDRQQTQDHQNSRILEILWRYLSTLRLFPQSAADSRLSDWENGRRAVSCADTERLKVAHFPEASFESDKSTYKDNLCLMVLLWFLNKPIYAHVLQWERGNTKREKTIIWFDVNIPNDLGGAAGLC